MTVSADTTRLAIVKLTGSPPAVPANPTFLVARMTGEGVAFTPQTTVSGELDPSGQVRDSILVGGASAGDVSCEISQNTFLEEVLSACFGSLWTPAVAPARDTLIPGTNLYQYLLEKRFDFGDGTFSYHRFSPSAIGTMRFEMAPGSPLTVAVGVNGGPMAVPASAIITGATYPDPGTNEVLAPHHVTVSAFGIAATACFGSLTIELNNNLRGIQCLGTLGEREKIRGRFAATISGQLYYASDEILNALVDQTEGSVVVTLDDAAGNPMYEFTFPRCKVLSAPVVAGGTGQDVVIDMSLQGLYDAGEGHTVELTRPGTL